MNTILKYFKYGLCISLCTVPMLANAAYFFAEGGKHTLVKGEEFGIVVSIDTDKERINAVEGQLVYPQDLIELVDVRDGNSVINFWLNRPKKTAPGIVAFSGTTPGGFVDSKAFIFTAIFRAKKDGQNQIQLDSLQVLKNDGEGTAVPVQAQPFVISISDEYKSSESVVGALIDHDSPEDFQPVIIQEPDMFDGQHVLVFSAEDKISGIDRYEIREGKIGLTTEATSPYVLKDQSLRSDIFITAIDKSGNKRVVLVQAKNRVEGYENNKLFGILVLVCIALLWFAIKKFKPRSKK